MVTRVSSRWSPTPLLKASAALHVGAAALALARPSLWPWALGAVILNHAQLTATGLWPRSTLLGPNLTRLPAAAARRGEIALSIDDGPDPAVTPQVLDLLDQYAVKATFFCVGRRVEDYAELAREIVRRGHAIENHSYRHLNYFPCSGHVRSPMRLNARRRPSAPSPVDARCFFALRLACAVPCSIQF